MKRRGFLASLLALAGLPGAGRAAPAPRHLLQTFPLAGFQYHQGEGLWPALAPGQPLELAREPANPHDPRAVRIDWGGQKLGYIPRADNAAVCQLLDRGATLRAEIRALAKSSSPWERVAVAVYLEVRANG